MSEFKVCPDCGVDKPISEYGRNAGRPDGLQFYCKACLSRRSARNYRERQRRKGRTIREHVAAPAGHKYCPGCKVIKPHADWHPSRHARDGFMSYCKECTKKRGRRDYLRRTFGIDEARLAEMIGAQGGVCAICRTAAPEHIDHDHATGRIRGVLCGRCNMGLGLFADDPARLVAASDYLVDAELQELVDTGVLIPAPPGVVYEVHFSHHTA